MERLEGILRTRLQNIYHRHIDINAVRFGRLFVLARKLVDDLLLTPPSN